MNDESGYDSQVDEAVDSFHDFLEGLEKVVVKTSDAASPLVDIYDAATHRGASDQVKTMAAQSKPDDVDWSSVLPIALGVAGIALTLWAMSRRSN